MQYVAPKLKEFVMHNFLASWQDEEYKLVFAEYRGKTSGIFNQLC